jgi:hypothetical protein
LIWLYEPNIPGDELVLFYKPHIWKASYLKNPTFEKPHTWKTPHLKNPTLEKPHLWKPYILKPTSQIASRSSSNTTLSPLHGPDHNALNPSRNL